MTTPRVTVWVESDDEVSFESPHHVGYGGDQAIIKLGTSGSGTWIYLSTSKMNELAKAMLNELESYEHDEAGEPHHAGQLWAPVDLSGR